MQLMAIMREVSATINRCELSFHARQPIDVVKAIHQHKAYQDCLSDLDVRPLCLAAEHELPDAVFVEDAAVVLDEIAIMPVMGAPSRRLEVANVANALADYRPITFLREPATLDGGDVLRVDRKIFVGLSHRTNPDGIAQLREVLGSFDYDIHNVAIRGCLHLKSACSYIGNDTLLVNCAWIDAEQFHGFELLNISNDEPAAANALLINDVVIMPDSSPKTRAFLQQRGFHIRTIDLSELEKAEAGVTCCSVIFPSRESNSHSQSAIAKML
jgi:dimethylargininase